MAEVDVYAKASPRRDGRSAVESSAAPLEDRSTKRYRRDALRRRLLALADVLAVLVAASVIELTGGGTSGPLLLVCLAPLWVVLAKLVGLYDRDHKTLRHLTVDELPWITAWAFVGIALVTVVLGPFPSLRLPARDAWRACLALIVAAGVARAAARRLWRAATPAECVLIVGDGPAARAILRKIELFPEMHIQVGAQVPAPSSLERWLIGPERPDRVIVAATDLGEGTIGDLLPSCREAGVKLTVVPPSRGMFRTGTQFGHLAELPLFEYNTWDISRSTLLLKRAFDVVAALLILVVLLVPLVLIGAAIYAYDRGPVLFRQRRAGTDGVPFTMLKFRTMVVDAEERLPELVRLEELDDPVFKLRQDPRVTPIGRVLRRFSLDELPQLVNAVRGDMSIVGPRPEQFDLVERYRPEHRFRHQVRPGLTGPMQVYGRGDLTFSERLAVEREYVENLSLARDFRILLMTLPAVLGRNGAY